VPLLVDAGASVRVADVNAARVDGLARELGVGAVPVERALTEPCDVLSPCALGSVITTANVAELRCRAVVGAANNQLADAGVDDALAERGILYAPDFVVNAGGIVNIAEEFVGYDRSRALARTAEIETTTTRVFASARELGVAPGRVAEAMARHRIEHEAVPGGRWRPGDPAPWTGAAGSRFPG
jgi:leucine dehydrogenase